MLALLIATAIGQFQPIGQEPSVMELRECYEKAQESYDKLWDMIQKLDARLQSRVDAAKHDPVRRKRYQDMLKRSRLRYLQLLPALKQHVEAQKQRYERATRRLQEYWA